MPRRKKAKENEREKLFQVKRKKCVQKEFDRADIVRDVRLCLPGVDNTSAAVGIEHWSCESGKRNYQEIVAIGSFGFRLFGFVFLRGSRGLRVFTGSDCFLAISARVLLKGQPP
jgi:hypothetical protein